jgi:diguanylate cyclase (GGDEF)-like protein
MVFTSQVVYAIFALPPGQVTLLIRLTLAGMGFTMLACNHLDPVRYPADVQAMAFLYACIVYPLIGSLATRLASISEKLRANRNELQQALAKVKELATRDDLTLTYNRRHMTELMQLEQRQHQRSGAPMCLALLDIDLFKAVNDQHGHQAGDEVLRRFALAARLALRDTDLLARWGGEEFMVLFVDSMTDEALQALQRLQAALQTSSFDDVAPGLRVSFSGGVAQLRLDEPIDAAVARADQAMYRAKIQGRSRCVVCDGTPVASLPVHSGTQPAAAAASPVDA